MMPTPDDSLHYREQQTKDCPNCAATWLGEPEKRKCDDCGVDGCEFCITCVEYDLESFWLCEECENKRG